MHTSLSFRVLLFRTGLNLANQAGGTDMMFPGGLFSPCTSPLGGDFAFPRNSNAFDPLLELGSEHDGEEEDPRAHSLLQQMQLPNQMTSSHNPFFPPSHNSGTYMMVHSHSSLKSPSPHYPA